MAMFLETDLGTRVYRVVSGVNDVLYSIANEPSLGMYRIQEHVSSTVPKIVHKKIVMEDLSGRVEGVTFDVEYDVEVLSAMASITQFGSIKSEIEKAAQLKRRLDEKQHELELERRQKLQAHAQAASGAGANSGAGVAVAPVRRNYGSLQQSSPLHKRMEQHGASAPTKDSSTASSTRSSSRTERVMDLKPKSFD